MHWKEIGILLDVDSKQLEELEQTCPNDFIRCCKEMINKWLQRDRNVSQKKLFACIKLATVTPLQISSTHKIGIAMICNRVVTIHCVPADNVSYMW